MMSLPNFKKNINQFLVLIITFLFFVQPITPLFVLADEAEVEEIPIPLEPVIEEKEEIVPEIVEDEVNEEEEVVEVVEEIEEIIEEDFIETEIEITSTSTQVE